MSPETFELLQFSRIKSLSLLRKKRTQDCQTNLISTIYVEQTRARYHDRGNGKLFVRVRQVMKIGSTSERIMAINSWLMTNAGMIYRGRAQCTRQCNLPAKPEVTRRSSYRRRQLFSALELASESREEATWPEGGCNKSSGSDEHWLLIDCLRAAGYSPGRKSRFLIFVAYSLLFCRHPFTIRT